MRVFNNQVEHWRSQPLPAALTRLKHLSGKLSRVSVTLLLAAALLLLISVLPQERTSYFGRTVTSAQSRPQHSGQGALKSFGELPRSFELNQGQFDKEVKFLSHGVGSDLCLTSDELVLKLSKRDRKPSSSLLKSTNSGQGNNKFQPVTSPRPAPGMTDVVRMRLVNARAATTVGLDELAGTVNYFIGKDPRKWYPNIRTYRRVLYQGVYPGIDQVFYGNERQLEYDFIVAPGANPNAIKFGFKGASDVAIDRQGDLVLHVNGAEEMRLHRPLVYQEVSGQKREVAARYVISAKRQVGFAVSDYDVSRPLVIDPILSYATYLGGNGNDAGFDVAVDASGSVYVTGSTDSGEFSPLGGTNAFVAKLNPAGTERTYMTIFGGSGDDTGFGTAVDNTGAAYVTGATDSTDFPVMGSNQLTFGGGSQDAFTAKLNPAGSGVIYATYFGGSGNDTGFGIAVDATGSAYMTGSTDSPELSTLGNTNAFVTKLSPSGNERAYLSILGGSGDDTGFDIAVDGGGSAYVVGSTDSTNFTTANALQPNFGGAQDAFVAKFNPVGSALVYSTYLGGAGNDAGFGIATDGAGNAYLTGSTDSPEFTTLGGRDIFVAKLSAAGDSRSYFSILGGNGDDVGFAIAVDSAGNAYVTGSTNSANFTTANPLQQNIGGAQNSFVAKLNSAGATLLSSTYLGGNGNDAGFGVVVDSANSTYITGFTSSSNFPTASPLQAANAGSGDIFIAKMSDSSAPAVLQLAAGNNSIGEGDGRVTLTITRTGDTSGATSVEYRTVDTDAFTFNCADTANNHGGAYARCDFAAVVGTLQFAAGETSKTITVPIVDDSYVEGNETFQIVLSNSTGATLGVPASATVTIQDNDTAAGANPVFSSPFFVRQQYLDFLSREPEQAGFNAWLNVLNGCSDVNNNPACDRITVSAAFFGSQEFQLKGFYVFRFYKVAFNRLPAYAEIIPDMSFVAGATAAEVFQRKAQLATGFTQRAEFVSSYGQLSPADYVSALLGRYQLTQITTPDPANPDGPQKVTLTSAELINKLNTNTLTRAQVFRAITDSDQVGAAEFNNAFVAMQYYGYLRRTPETSGYNAWLMYLNAHPADSRTMVNGFMNSTEYRLRFGQP